MREDKYKPGAQDGLIIMIQLASAVVHLQEHIDTGEGADLSAAQSCLDHPLVQKWMSNNSVLLPLRRDAGDAGRERV